MSLQEMVIFLHSCLFFNFSSSIKLKLINNSGKPLLIKLQSKDNLYSERKKILFIKRIILVGNVLKFCF